MYEGRLTENRKLRENLIAIFSKVEGNYREDEARLTSEVHSKRTQVTAR